MYTKQQASEIRKSFWTKFGQYMRPIPFAGGQKNNWVNYKTGVKGIRFIMDAHASTAIVGIELSGSFELRKKYFETFKALTENFPEGYTWLLNTKDEHGTQISLIAKELTNTKIMNESHWPGLISFFKENILALDSFWAGYKEIFEMLP